MEHPGKIQHRYPAGLLSSFQVLYSATLLFIFSTIVQAESPVIESQQAAVDRAMQINRKYRLSRLSEDCLVFSVWDKLVNGKYIIDVREHHNGKCGGSPGASPRLFSLHIVQETGEVWTDADSMTGEFRLLK